MDVPEKNDLNLQNGFVLIEVGCRKLFELNPKLTELRLAIYDENHVMTGTKIYSPPVNKTRSAA